MAEKNYKNYIETVSTYSDWEGMPKKYDEEAIEPDYIRLDQARKESERRYKLVSTANKIDDEKRKKVISAIATGVCFSALMASTLFSGNDLEKMAQLGLNVFNNMELVPEYLQSFTPAMWLSVVGTATSFVKYIKHSKKEKEAERDFDNMLALNPTYFMGEVKQQAKKR